MDEAELERILVRAGLDSEPAKLHSLAFRDRSGYVHLPFEAAEAVARAFAAAEPTTVLLYVEGQEESMKARGYAPGDRIYHDFLREEQPSFALVRQWAGHENEIEDLRKEIGRLRSLVSMAASDLVAAGADRKAWRLRRALDGR